MRKRTCESDWRTKVGHFRKTLARRTGRQAMSSDCDGQEGQLEHERRMTQQSEDAERSQGEPEHMLRSGGGGLSGRKQHEVPGELRRTSCQPVLSSNFLRGSGRAGAGMS
ncbi:hypothetical protein AcV7_009822 [Taiwanofungus camphoratus]|nr:hypothetical protein AcV7_009822 [Antrodia cinnamomea]